MDQIITKMTVLLSFCCKMIFIVSVLCTHFAFAEQSQQTLTNENGSSMKTGSIDTTIDLQGNILDSTKWYMWKSDRWSDEDESLLMENDNQVAIGSDPIQLGVPNASRQIQIIDPHELYNSLWTHFHQSILKYFSNSTPFEMELEFEDYEEYLTTNRISRDDLDLKYEADNLESSKSSIDPTLPSSEVLASNRPSAAVDKNNISEILHRFFQPFLLPSGQYQSWKNIPKEQKNIYLSKELGHPQRYSHVVTISLVVYYGGLLLLGIPGNVLTCLIILTNPYMRTAPNIYLLNLAVVDLVTLTMSKYLSI